MVFINFVCVSGPEIVKRFSFLSFILSYVTELTELIKAKSSSAPDKVKDSIEFVSFFPDFVWTVRDFTLEMKIDDLPITEDEYLEDALKLIPGIGAMAWVAEGHLCLLIQYLNSIFI